LLAKLTIDEIYSLVDELFEAHGAVGFRRCHRKNDDIEKIHQNFSTKPIDICFWQ
jgi:hypothetical protein